ncbi:MAG: efflux RND transporter periplasmic adaptor subunit [Marinilabiliaceae bacterium]|nr:efflux RND transporter periplasmic adaptor subunit [Marinilabiliaceae bacterium]
MKRNNLKDMPLFVVMLVMIFVSCSPKDGANSENGQTVTDSVKVTPVRTITINEQEIIRTLDYTANLIPNEEINYAPAIPGRIDRIHVEVGSKVKKGQILVEMDKTQLNQVRSQYENAKYNFQQIDTLYQLKSISEQQYEQVKTNYEIQKASYDNLLKNSTLISPVDGIVTGKYFENGEMYQGTPNTQAGKAAILTLMQINPIKAEVSIAQSYYNDVKPGMKAEITCDILTGQTFDGTISMVYPTIDANTRSFKVEIVINNNNEALRPGMFSNISIRLNVVKAVVVPAIAVLKQEGTNRRYIFVNENGTARQIVVKIGKRFDEKIEIICQEPINGKQLIYEGQANLMDGSKLKVANN